MCVSETRIDIHVYYISLGDYLKVMIPHTDHPNPRCGSIRQSRENQAGLVLGSSHDGTILRLSLRARR